MDKQIHSILKTNKIKYIYKTTNNDETKIIINNDITCIIKYSDSNFYLQFIDIFLNKKLFDYNFQITLCDHPFAKLPKNMDINRISITDNNSLLQINNLSISINDNYHVKLLYILNNNNINNIDGRLTSPYNDKFVFKDNYIENLYCDLNLLCAINDNTKINKLYLQKYLQKYDDINKTINELNQKDINSIRLKCFNVNHSYQLLSNIEKTINILDIYHVNMKNYNSTPSNQINNVNILVYDLHVNSGDGTFNSTETLLNYTDQKMHIIKVYNLYALNLLNITNIINNLNMIKNNNKLFLIIEKNLQKFTVMPEPNNFYEIIDNFINIHNIKILFEDKKINSITKKYNTLMDILHLNKLYPINLFM